MSEAPSTRSSFDFVVDTLRNASRVCVLTGAGISAESGVATFRGADGMWEKYDYRRLATPKGFADDPRLVWEWYQLRQRAISESVPNAAHNVLALMESHYDEFTLVTQNIDGLHARAGNTKIVELHGNIWRMRCEREHTVTAITEPVEHIPPICHCGDIMRPDVVWFGEQLTDKAIESASKAASGCDVMLVVGTSAIVYPAAALPVITKDSGGSVLEVNLEPTEVSTYADASLFGRAGDILPEVWMAIKDPESFMK